MIDISELYLPRHPKIRWWWSRARKERARVAYVRSWQRSMWEQTGGAPVHLGTYR